MHEIDKSLGLPPLTGDIVDDKEEKEISDGDFEYARGNLISVIETGTKALEDILDVARSSEHPRAYEVVATLMKTISDTNRDLIDLAKKKKELDKSDKSEDQKQVTNNNLFVGSTAELQKMLKNLNGD